MIIGIDCHNLEGYRTGTARYLMNLLEHWAKEFPPKADQPRTENIELILYFKERTPNDISPKNKNFKSRVLKTNSNAWFEHVLLPRAIKKDKIDIFFSPSYILPFWLPKRVKKAVALHDISFEAHPKWYSLLNRILLRGVAKKTIKKADLIFVPSQFTKKEIIKYYKIYPKKIFVIPLAADQKFKNVGYPVSHIKKKYGVRDKFIFYVGAIFNRRFIPEVIKAFSKIASNFPNYQFLIAGPNYTYPFIDVDELVKKTNHKIKREAILRVDYVQDNDLVFLYNAADLFVWLSEYEGFGLPPIEAMACGTPVLTTKKTSLAEVLGNYPVWVDDPKDVDEISRKMYKILTNKNLCQELVKKGLAQAQKFSWQKTAEKTLQILLKQGL